MKEITYNDLIKANEGLRTTPIERFNKKTGQTDVKEYVDVAQRVKAFRRVYPMGFIQTQILNITDGIVTMQARVGYYDAGAEIVIATGLAQEVQSANIINKTSYIENCETSAVGRALGMAGFGIDAGIASADEMKSALKAQAAIEGNAPEVTKAAAKATKSAKAKERLAQAEKAARGENTAPQDDADTISREAAKKLSNMVVIIDQFDKEFWPDTQKAFGFLKSTGIKRRDYNTIVTLCSHRLRDLQGEGKLDKDYQPIKEPAKEPAKKTADDGFEEGAW